MRRHLIYALWVALFVPPAVAREPAKILQLSPAWGTTAGGVGLRDGLVGLGYRENRDFFIGVRFTQGDLAALSQAAREAMDYGIDLIFASGETAALAALKATSQVPIVCLCDAVEIGAANSLARPGKNLTGVSTLTSELGPKRLQLFRELVPDLKRVLFAFHPLDMNASIVLRRYRAAARRLGIELLERVIRTGEEAQSILSVRRGDVDGILAPAYAAMDIPGLLLKLSAEQGIPTMFPGGTLWVKDGALISYGPDYEDSGRLAARLVDKILRGGNPAEIPIERNPNVKLFLNVKAAANMGIRIPPSLLARADKVFE